MPFSQKTLDFLLENSLQNSRDWFDEHKNEYKQYVFELFAEFVASMAKIMLSIDGMIVCEPKVDRTISRIHRDTRFSKDKALFRDHMWCGFKRDKKLFPLYPEFFFAAMQQGFCYGCGYYNADAATVESIRNLILKNDPCFTEALNAFENQRVFKFEGDTYKKSKYPDKPENIRNWLDRKGIAFICESKDYNLLFSDSLPQKIAEDYLLLKPIYEFLIKAEQMK